MSILAVAGDIGGQKALIPVLDRMSEENIDFKVVEHRGLENVSGSWKTIYIAPGEENGWKDNFTGIKALIFSTSVKDLFPLKLAKKAKELNIPVFCLLDNWMNYRKRLELDGVAFLPDKYLIMDDIAYNGALADGMPESILEITGQPALTDIQNTFEAFSTEKRNNRRKELGLDLNKELIVFISEPAEADQGKNSSNPAFRGYTEKTVLKGFLHELQPFSAEIQIAIVPHPRENKDCLLDLWSEDAGNLEGGFFDFENGREAIMLADGVSGMASILLHEAWFIGTPTISLQPNPTREDLLILQYREGVICLTDNSEWQNKTHKWIKEVLNFEPNKVRKELSFHKNAADNIIRLIQMELV